MESAHLKLEVIKDLIKKKEQQINDMQSELTKLHASRTELESKIIPPENNGTRQYYSIRSGVTSADSQEITLTPGLSPISYTIVTSTPAKGFELITAYPNEDLSVNSNANNVYDVLVTPGDTITRKLIIYL